MLYVSGGWVLGIPVSGGCNQFATNSLVCEMASPVLLTIFPSPISQAAMMTVVAVEDTVVDTRNVRCGPECWLGYDIQWRFEWLEVLPLDDFLICLYGLALC